jgi:large subunit ribosomal protein L10
LALTKVAKERIVEEYSEKFRNASSAIVTEYRGLTVEQMTKVRRKLREVKAEYHVIKNTLAQIAIKDTPFEKISDKFTGPTAVVLCFHDPVETAKAILSFKKEIERLKIITGQLGQQVLSIQDVENLSKLPGLQETRAQLLGVINAPLQKLLAQIQAPGQQLASVIKQRGDKLSDESTPAETLTDESKPAETLTDESKPNE